MHPEIAKSNYLKSCLGIIFNEENIFALAKKRAMVNEGAGIVQTLSGMQDPVSQKPIFAIEWLVKEFMGLTDNDLEVNRQYMKKQILADIERQKLIKKHMQQQPTTQAGNQEGTPGAGAGFGGDTGGGFGVGDTGAGFDAGGFGGGDAGGDSGFGLEDAGNGVEAAPEAPPAEPAADTGGGFGE